MVAVVTSAKKKCSGSILLDECDAEWTQHSVIIIIIKINITLIIILCVICNSFTICNAEMQEVGVGLYPSMSLLNHSCDPNCSIVFNGPHLLLRAVREIEAGEELTICYLDMLMTSEERRKQLRDQYCFECDCIRCQTQDKAIISSNSERLPDINIYQLKVLDCAMDACINLGMLEEALFYAMRTMEPYRISTILATASLMMMDHSDL
ncbi:hypothetical protein STEG23_013380, partial [Scotinomys teguina]